jgi:dihydrofolate reductase
MQLTTVTNVSLDGVTQGHRRIQVGTRGEASVPTENGSGAFERFGWGPPLLDDNASRFISETFQRADAFLFGRRTYEIFAGSWGTWDDPGDSPIWTALNTRPKYVASTTPFDPEWANTTVLSGDVSAAIRELKAEAGGELQVHGSGVLIRWLLDNGLVDEINLLTMPVVVGQGTRLFPDTGPDIALELVGSQAVTPSGVTIQVYRPAGRPQYGTASAN